MTDDIKPLNLNTEAEDKPEPVAQKEPVKKVAEVVQPEASTPAKKKMISWFMVLVLLGMGTGYGIYFFTKPKAPKKLDTTVTGELVTGDTFGVEDEEAFRDTAEGVMMAGGVDGEGSHHLERDGGESQYVYLTSSVIDLDQFLDKKVKVWGETFEAQQAGWLMDVGRLEILE